MSAATDLRHMTSNPALVSPRLSQHLRTHSPARSPTSIPSSPTSVHSSSSAIFERDIEPLSPPSPQTHTTHTHPPNAHRIPRSKTTEQIEHSVPSVLDSAAAILASIQNTNDVSIVAPAPPLPPPLYHACSSSGFASPIGSFRSRSPSPTIGSLGRNSLLLSIPQQQQQQQVQQVQQQQQQQVQTQTQTTQQQQAAPPAVQSPPSIQTTNVSPSPSAPPAIVTPTSAYYSVADESEADSVLHSADETEDSADATIVPAHPRHEELPQTPSPFSNPSSLPPQHPRAASSSPPSSSSPPHSYPQAQAHAQSPTTSTSPHAPPNPTTTLTAASKRLSFISYADLLASSPTSTLPLSSLTTAASASEPPPHLPAVSASTSGGISMSSALASGLGAGLGSAGTSLRGFVVTPTTVGGAQVGSGEVFGSNVGGGAGSASVRGKKDRERDRDSMVGGLGPDDVGGEWEREGLGRGLEERMDVLYGSA